MPSWNPWHGCKKISEGCRHCYVYRQDERYGVEIHSSIVRKNKSSFDLPLKRKRDKTYKLSTGQTIFTCFTSDFFIKEADEWRKQAWAMIRQRNDLRFLIFTKRVDRIYDCIPEDWADGYENVMVSCSVENQAMANYRLPILLRLPIRHKAIIVAPMLEKMDISSYLNSDIKEVVVGGESGVNARICDYLWVLDIRRQCIENDIPFIFHQTGARFLKDGRLYNIRRNEQEAQAKKACIDT
ncbi:MAG: phage Gp37/Gp68 family protein [Candidatus Cloacimonetes bacterium]|nr:phage Gp37/Gp68 family protein [Candidatus Cloacimonadota bacterium]